MDFKASKQRVREKSLKAVVRQWHWNRCCVRVFRSRAPPLNGMLYSLPSKHTYTRAIVDDIYPRASVFLTLQNSWHERVF